MSKYTPVKELRADYIDAKPIGFDFSEGWLSTWEFRMVVKCGDCGRIFTTSNNWAECEECGDEVCADGPAMNYIYPIGNVDTEIYMPNLCVVEYDDDNYLALTAGGMDLSWSIAEAYMLQGYLPPIHFARLPNMAGMTYSKKNAWIIAGMRRSLKIAEQRIKWDKQDLSRLVKELKNRD